MYILYLALQCIINENFVMPFHCFDEWMPNLKAFLNVELQLLCNL